MSFSDKKFIKCYKNLTEINQDYIDECLVEIDIYTQCYFPICGNADITFDSKSNIITIKYCSYTGDKVHKIPIDKCKNFNHFKQYFDKEKSHGTK
jgi:hypothetical protein